MPEIPEIVYELLERVEKQSGAIDVKALPERLRSLDLFLICRSQGLMAHPVEVRSSIIDGVLCIGGPDCENELLLTEKRRLALAQKRMEAPTRVADLVVKRLDRHSTKQQHRLTELQADTLDVIRSAPKGKGYIAKELVHHLRDKKGRTTTIKSLQNHALPRLTKLRLIESTESGYQFVD